MVALQPTYTRDGMADEGVAILLPGIQSYAGGQALGLLPLLCQRYSKVVGFDYNKGQFRPRTIAKAIAAYVADLQQNGKSVTIIGMSLGAPLSVLVTAELRKLRRLQLNDPNAMGHAVTVDGSNRYRIIMVDPPFGAKTMKGIPQHAILRPLTGLVLALGGLLVPPFVSIDSQAKRVEDPAVFALPDSITMGIMFGRAVSPTESQGLLVEADYQNQLGHSLRTWMQQLAWLVWAAPRLDFSVMNHVQVDLITTDGTLNTVVRSALAAVKWQQQIPGMWLTNAGAVEHCATLRDRVKYVSALWQVLGAAH